MLKILSAAAALSLVATGVAQAGPQQAFSHGMLLSRIDFMRDCDIDLNLNGQNLLTEYDEYNWTNNPVHYEGVERQNEMLAAAIEVDGAVSACEHIAKDMFPYLLELPK